MEIKKPRELTLRDLPYIESPSIAAQNVGWMARRPFSTLKLDQRLVQCSPLDRPLSTDELIQVFKRGLEEGELMLVYGITDGHPFSPLVVWEGEGQMPGRWRLKKTVGSRLEGWVDQLNDWQITPEQVRHLGPGGIGHLSASTFDLDLREQQADERARASESRERQLSSPIGAVAAVAPIAVEASHSNDGAEPRKKLHVEVGIFTDGTLNNAGNIKLYNEKLETSCVAPYREGEISDEECERRLALMMGASYANAITNIHKLWTLYPEWDQETESERKIGLAIYVPGVGTETGGEDSLTGMAMGVGETGIVMQVRRALEELARLISNSVGKNAVDSLAIDIFGFSRGAAAARHAMCAINDGSSGALGEAFSNFGLAWPKKVAIRFAGLFDTVAGIANVKGGDFSASNAKNSPVRLYLAPDSAKSVVHLTARDECRKNFALNSIRNPDGVIAENFREIGLPGVHSDVGGGYHDAGMEVHMLAPSAEVQGLRSRWPEETMAWDGLEQVRQHTLADQWVGKHSLQLLDGDEASIKIEKEVRNHPSPDGEITLKLIMRRYVLGEYSRVNLKLMHTLAKKHGVPFVDIPTRQDLNIPSELTGISESIMSRVLAGDDHPKLPAEEESFLKQRYVHRSDHYDFSEMMVAGTILQIEMPAPVLNPFKPTSDRIRIKHPNRKDV